MFRSTNPPFPLLETIRASPVVFCVICVTLLQGLVAQSKTAFTVQRIENATCTAVEHVHTQTDLRHPIRPLGDERVIVSIDRLADSYKPDRRLETGKRRCVLAQEYEGTEKRVWDRRFVYALRDHPVLFAPKDIEASVHALGTKSKVIEQLRIFDGVDRFFAQHAQIFFFMAAVCAPCNPCT